MAHFFQSAHSIWMDLDAGGIQAHLIYLNLDDTQLLQMQDSLFAQMYSTAFSTSRLPMFGKVVFDLLILFYC